LNGYLAIDANISNEPMSENGYMEISVETNSLIKPNKNIWKGVSISGTNAKKNSKFDPITKLDSGDSDNSDNLNDSGDSNDSDDSDDSEDLNDSEDSEDSEIEESEICFDKSI
jgi:hypothetical protein